MKLFVMYVCCIVMLIYLFTDNVDKNETFVEEWLDITDDSVTERDEDDIERNKGDTEEDESKEENESDAKQNDESDKENDVVFNVWLY